MSDISCKPSKCNFPEALSENKASETAELMKALAHPVRLQILHYLGGQKNCCCNEICACIPLAQSTISQHLKILSNAGVIDYQPAGNTSQYSLNAASLENILKTIGQLNEIANAQTSSCSEMKVK